MHSAGRIFGALLSSAAGLTPGVPVGPVPLCCWRRGRTIQSFETKKLPLPELGEFGVRARVVSCGVCHTDFVAIRPGRVPGHEVRRPCTRSPLDAVLVGTRGTPSWHTVVAPPACLLLTAASRVGLCPPPRQIVATVEAVGHGVKDLAPGDRVGMGFQVGACLACDTCLHGHEQSCPDVVTYFSTTGGYAPGPCSPSPASCLTTAMPAVRFASHVTWDSRFTFKIPDGLESKHASPLLCAGATVYVPRPRPQLDSLGHRSHCR